jgi:ATPase subunit of ABC transporter with duplicated ATPase domains
VAERLGNNVIEADGLTKGLWRQAADRWTCRSSCRRAALSASSGQRRGKTTLFRMITGQEQPDGGSITIGETVQLGYVDQSRDALDPKKTVWEEISGGNEIIKLGKRERDQFAPIARRFNFKGGDQQQPVGSLSGGQRNRVHLAKMLKSGLQRAAARRTDQ